MLISLINFAAEIYNRTWVCGVDLGEITKLGSKTFCFRNV